MQTALKHIKSELLESHENSEVYQLWLLIMQHITRLDHTSILLNKNTILSVEQTQKVATIIDRLKNEEPIQYIFEETEFFSLPFKVNKNVLIPRPETEELVDWVIKENTGSQGRLLDIGTGSGCIAITLAKYLSDAQIFGWDISNETLNVAQKNAKLNDAHVNFEKIDILNVKKKKIFDIIVSNPPYICEKEQHDMAKNVLDYEPHHALFVNDNDPLIFYKKIIAFATKNLSINGKIYFEINRAFGKEICELLQQSFNHIELRKDISGNDRMIRAIKR